MFQWSLAIKISFCLYRFSNCFSDPLVPVPHQRWQEVRDRFRKWPEGVPGYYALDMQIRYPDLTTTCSVQLFAPYGHSENGVVMFHNKSGQKEMIILPTLTVTGTKRLVKALVRTKRIDWTKEQCIPWADSRVVKLMKRVAMKLALQEVRNSSGILHIRRKDSPVFKNLLPPRNTYIEPLKPNHILQVDAAWPQRYSGSSDFFALLIRNGLSYGIFSSSSNDLLAWIFINEVGALTHLYCEKKYRGKGFADFLVKYVANDLLEQGKDVFLFILEDTRNVKSLGLFRLLKFDIVGRGTWMYYIQKDEKNNVKRDLRPMKESNHKFLHFTNEQLHSMGYNKV